MFDQALKVILRHEGGYVNHHFTCERSHNRLTLVYDKRNKTGDQNQGCTRCRKRQALRPAQRHKQQGIRLFGGWMSQSGICKRTLQRALYQGAARQITRRANSEARAKNVMCRMWEAIGQQGRMVTVQDALPASAAADYPKGLRRSAGRKMRQVQQPVSRPRLRFSPSFAAREGWFAIKHDRRLLHPKNCAGSRQVHPALRQLSQD